MKKKRFFLSHPVLAAFLLPALGEFWVSLPGVFPQSFGMMNDTTVQLIVYLLMAGFALLLLKIHKHHYRPDYRGSFRKEGFSDVTAWICIGIFLAADLIIYVYGGLQHGFYAFDLTYLIPSLNAGVCEETVFRVLPLSVMMYSFRKKESAWAPLILTSAVFGLIHLGNLKAGAALGITVLQVTGAGISGLFLGALYLRTGNIFLSMLLHTLHDFISFLGIGGYSALTMDVTPEMLVEEGILAAVELVCICLLMKDQKKLHLPVWDERWSEAPLPETDPEPVSK